MYGLPYYERGNRAMDSEVALYNILTEWDIVIHCVVRLLEDWHENTHWHLNKYEQFIHYLYSIYTPMPF